MSDLEIIPLDSIQPDAHNANKGLKPSPGFAVFYIADSSVGNTEQRGNLSVKHLPLREKLFDSQYLRLRQFALSVSATFNVIARRWKLPSMPDGILRVFLRRAPIQIRQSVVSPITVPVTALVSGGAWAGKRLYNESVDIRSNSFAIGPEGNVGVTSLNLLGGYLPNWAANVTVHVAIFVNKITGVFGFFNHNSIIHRTVLHDK